MEDFETPIRVPNRIIDGYIINDHDIVLNPNTEYLIKNDKCYLRIEYAYVDGVLYAGHHTFYYHNQRHYGSGASKKSISLDCFKIQRINSLLQHILNTDDTLIRELKKIRNQIIQPQLRLF
jgi:hypothetical protein